jgi:cytochrome c oxidase cbb3-type subunit 3
MRSVKFLYHTIQTNQFTLKNPGMNFRKHKFTTTVVLITVLINSATAQVSADASSQAQLTFFDKFPDYIQDPAIWLGVLVSFIILFVIYALARTVISLSHIVSPIEKKESVLIKMKIKKESSWNKLMRIMTKSVSVEQEADVMLDHNYDGIRELDNQLPPWWKWGFYSTILFAVFYLFSYHVAGTGRLSIQEYADEMKHAQLEKEERMKDAANNITESNVVAFTDVQQIAEGKIIFEKNCVACHGNSGQGNVGPNLTDEFWLHGGGIKNIFNTVTNGVPAKGMISWKAQLAPRQIQQVASFILTLKGTNPAGAKEPQGEKWVEEIKRDSSVTVMKDSVNASKKL